jgi:hypothetical protein
MAEEKEENIVFLLFVKRFKPTLKRQRKIPQKGKQKAFLCGGR